MGYPFFGFLLPDSPFLAAVGIACAFVLIAVPLLTLINVVQRLAFKRHINSTFMTSSWLLWVVAAIGGIGIGTHITQDFKVGKTLSRNIDTNNLSSDTVRISFTENPYKNGFIKIGPNQVFDDELINSYVRLKMERAKGSEVEITQVRHSQGRSINEAEMLASNIEIQPEVSESSITIPTWFRLPKGEKYRGQHVKTTIKVPVGKYVVFDDAHNIYRDINLDYDRRFERPRYGHIDDDQVWYMAEEGLMLPSYQDNPNELSYRDFEEIDISGPLKVEFKRSDKYEVTMRGRSRYKKLTNFSKEGKKLTVEFTEDRPGSPLRLLVKAPDLSSIKLYDTDDVSINDFEFEDLYLEANGRHEIKGRFNAQKMNVRLEGRTRMKLRGEADEMTVLLKDETRLDGEDFVVRKADVKTRDSHRSNRIELAVKDTLYHDLSYSHNMNIEGRPWTLDRTVIEEAEPLSEN